MIDLFAVGLVVVGVVLALVGAGALARRRADRRWGRPVAFDDGPAPPLRSERYRLAGRPDILRRLPDGRVVPIEVKSRPRPARGPYRSHLVQLASYCLLVEETTHRSPPFGVLRYRDCEYVVPWDAASRADVLELLDEVRRPYDGRATPSPARCRACLWRPGCDARAA